MHVSLISDESIKELTQGTDFTVTDRVVTLAKATSLKIKIYRETTTKPLVGWADASVLKAADMTVQSTQLLHLAEETSDLAQDGGLSKDTTDNVWDARFNKIKNLLDPTDPGDAVPLNYITKNQDSLLTQLRNTGAAQNASIVSTGDSQNARLTSTGDTQNTRLNTTGDTQDKRLNDLGQKYVDLMTGLKDTATTKATEADNSAELSKKWAMSDVSPDGVSGNKSSKTWAEEAKASASNSASSASASQSSAETAANYANKAMGYAEAPRGQAPNGSTSARIWAEIAGSKANAATSSASDASTSASNASTSATNAKTSETNAASSAAAAAKSAIDAAKFDPTFYLKGESALGVGTDSNPQVIPIPVKKGLYPIIGYPDGFDSTTDLYPYALVANFQGNEKGRDAGALISLYASDRAKHLYFRTGWGDTGWRKPWFKLANVDDIPTKTSQLTNDSGYVNFTDGKSLEVGQYMDLHDNTDMSVDYTFRLNADGSLTRGNGAYIQVLDSGHLSINGSELWIE